MLADEVLGVAWRLDRDWKGPWRKRLWTFLLSTRPVGALHLLFGLGALLRLLELRDMTQCSIAFINFYGSTALGLIVFMYHSRRVTLREKLLQVADLSRLLEKDAQEDARQDIQSSVRVVRIVVRFLYFTGVSVTFFIVTSPLFTGDLPMRMYFKPRGALWHVVNAMQAYTSCATNVAFYTVQSTLAASTLACACLLRQLGVRLQEDHRQTLPELFRTVRLHQRLLALSEGLQDDLSFALTVALSTYFVLSMLSTINIVYGTNIDPFLGPLLPQAIMSFVVMVWMSDTLMVASEGLSGRAYCCPWYERGGAFRGALVLVQARASRATAMHTFMPGSLHMPSVVAAANAWYSYLNALLSLR